MNKEKIIGVTVGLAGIVLSLFVSQEDLAAGLIMSLSSGYLIGISFQA